MAVHFCVVDLSDHTALCNAGFGNGGIADLPHIHTGFQAVKTGRIGIYILAGDPQHGAVLHIAVLLQVIDNGLRRIHGDGKSQPLVVGSRDLGRIDAHYLAV